MCKSASGQRPSPHCRSMKPICATVDQASAVLTALWVSMTVAPNSAVKPPTMTRAAIAPGLALTSGASLMSNTPPELMIPAWRNAETGVGASMTSVTQPCSGKAAVFSVAAITISATANWAGVDSPG